MNYGINIHKRIIALLLSVVIVFSAAVSCPVKVQAVVGVDDVILASLAATVGIVIAIEQSEGYNDWYSVYREKWQNSMEELFNLVGLKVSFGGNFPDVGPDPIQEIKRFMSQGSGTPVADITDDQAKQFAYNMYNGCVIDQSQDSFTFSSDLEGFVKYLMGVYMENTGFVYGYTVDIHGSALNFSDGNWYQALRAICEEYQDNYVILLQRVNMYTDNIVYMFPKSDELGFLKTANTQTKITCDLYSLMSWQRLMFNANNNVIAYKYNTDTKKYDIDSTFNFNHTSYNKEYFVTYPEFVLPSGWNSVNANNGYNWTITYDRSEVFKVYLDINSLKGESLGISPYYQTQYFGDFINNSNNPYTVNNTNYNPITYNTINKYITDTKDTTDKYPTPTEINIFIKDYDPTYNPSNPSNPVNPNNPSTGGGNNNVSGNGSSAATANATANATNGNVNVTINNNPSITLGWGSLSGNSVSGNGTVSGNAVSNGVGDIFSFLSGIGQSLASLVKNLGKALTELLDALISIIDDILVKIPNVLTSLLEIVFGGLPDEIKAVIMMGIVLMVTFGIIKVIRG